MGKHRENSFRYIFQNQPKVKIVCLICQRETFSETAARLHTKAVHGTMVKISKKQCGTCGKYFDTEAKLLDHVKGHGKRIKSSYK